MNDNELARIRNEEIGFVFQTFNLLPRATALHNVELPLVYAGVAGEGAAGARQGRRSRRSSYVARMRTGRTSCRAASASASRSRARSSTIPSILLADEPTGNLDSKTGTEIMALFERLHKAGNTIVLVTHEPDIAAYAHRVIHIRDGQVEKDVKRRAAVASRASCQPPLTSSKPMLRSQLMLSAECCSCQTAAPVPGADLAQRRLAVERRGIEHDALACGASGSGTGIADSSARV